MTQTLRTGSLSRELFCTHSQHDITAVIAHEWQYHFDNFQPYYNKNKFIRQTYFNIYITIAPITLFSCRLNSSLGKIIFMFYLYVYNIALSTNVIKLKYIIHTRIIYYMYLLHQKPKLNETKTFHFYYVESTRCISRIDSTEYMY